MSYEEMQAMMRRQGVDLPPLAPTAARSQGTAETPPGLSLAALGNMSSEEVKRVFDVIGAMTPAQQDACFALSRWQAAVAPSALALQPPLGFPQRRLGPVYGPLPGAPAQPMMAPRQ
jgi:hypothetical protein